MEIGSLLDAATDPLKEIHPLAAWATAKLVGKELALVEAVLHQDSIPLKDFAALPAVKWDAEDNIEAGYKSLANRVNKKLKNLGYRIERHKNAASLRSLVIEG